jgi:hypothetical protein
MYSKDLVFGSVITLFQLMSLSICPTFSVMVVIFLQKISQTTTYARMYSSKNEDFQDSVRASPKACACLTTSANQKQPKCNAAVMWWWGQTISI